MATIYQIHLKGHVDHDWSTWMTQICVVHEPSGLTILTGAVLDQSALHGLLRRVRDLGITLLAVCAEQTDLEACEVIKRRNER